MAVIEVQEQLYTPLAGDNVNMQVSWKTRSSIAPSTLFAARVVEIEAVEALTSSGTSGTHWGINIGKFGPWNSANVTYMQGVTTAFGPGTVNVGSIGDLNPWISGTRAYQYSTSNIPAFWLAHQTVGAEAALTVSDGSYKRYDALGITLVYFRMRDDASNYRMDVFDEYSADGLVRSVFIEGHLQKCTIGAFDEGSGIPTHLETANSFAANGYFAINVSFKRSTFQGSISSPISEWKSFVSVFNEDMVKEKEYELVDPSSYSFVSEGNRHKYLMLHQVRTNRWNRDTTVDLDYPVAPSDTTLQPYYLKCTVAGVTGATEPLWDLPNTSTYVDGTATWTMVERIKRPVIEGPVKGFDVS